MPVQVRNEGLYDKSSDAICGFAPRGRTLSMIFDKPKLPGAVDICIEKIFDERGLFAHIFCQREFEASILNGRLVQSSLSFNKRKETLRGMH